MPPCPAVTLARGHSLLSVRIAVTSSDSGTNSAATSGGAVLTVASATPKLAGSHILPGEALASLDAVVGAGPLVLVVPEFLLLSLLRGNINSFH